MRALKLANAFDRLTLEVSNILKGPPLTRLQEKIEEEKAIATTVLEQEAHHSFVLGYRTAIKDVAAHPQKMIRDVVLDELLENAKAIERGERR